MGPKEFGTTKSAKLLKHVMLQSGSGERLASRPSKTIPYQLETNHIDNGAKIKYLEDIELILHIFRDSNMVIDPVSTREVQTALKKLKSNKAADCMDITCEHLNICGIPVILF